VKVILAAICRTRDRNYETHHRRSFLETERAIWITDFVLEDER
jgi:hypothetical protein